MSPIRAVALAMDLATTRRDQAVKVLQSSQQAQLSAAEQLAQLEGYASETESKWATTTQLCATPELLRHHYQFMGRLHQAIVLQQDAVNNALISVQQSRQKVLEAELRLASLKQMRVKKEAEQMHQMNRREQKQMDEFSSLRSQQMAGSSLSEVGNDH
jgi:flagellar protein FliJ